VVVKIKNDFHILATKELLQGNMGAIPHSTTATSRMRANAGLVIVRECAFRVRTEVRRMTAFIVVCVCSRCCQVGKNVTLVPYEKEHVPKYHQWMTDPWLQGTLSLSCDVRFGISV
jgi:hypothetical protein